MTFLTRRQALYGAAAGIAAAATGARPAAAAATLLSRAATTPVDVLVIGSGYAGAVTALRLAEAGYSTVVLERGRRWTVTASHDTFATVNTIDGRAAWLSHSSPFTDKVLPKAAGVLEAYAGLGVVCLAGAGVGGGSLVNNAVMMQPSKELFTRGIGAGLPWDEMDRTWYPRARDLIGVSPIPADVLAAPAYANAREFLAEARAAGLTAVLPDMAMNWDVVRQELAGTIPPAATVGDSILGINSGAKRSVDTTILARAEATGRAEVVPLHVVRRIAATGGRYTVTADRIDDSGQVRATVAFSARRVFLAAGSLGTTRLLVESGAEGLLPGLPAEVGRQWSSSGDHVVLRTGVPAPSAAQGGPANAVITDWANPVSPVTLLNFPLGVPALAGKVREMLAVGMPPPLGSWRYSRLTRKAVLTWPALDPRVLRITQAVTSTAARLDAASGGIGFSASLSALTSHSLGGAALGAACGEDGEVIGCPGLFVVDSALIPGGIGAVPPALTVTAVADRTVSRALSRLSA
ncbi:FAD-dependent oxidoreductase [Actinoplanes sp. N902-109]|uniref:FAD-dependent oxidoreductase n=1 Tax=Actinoplanes sp. (strain N902-109) TaxID=649831 RepID=UPI0003296113|nr:FAD-dependent oxidoreductase [Actinoplanes sp. N902-109]AGL16393.1 Cholesterol oxidase [Actinoplanes sp. N902-109]